MEGPRIELRGNDKREEKLQQNKKVSWREEKKYYEEERERLREKDIEKR